MIKRFNGQLLLLARQVRKISQSELVDRLNGLITQGTLSKIEHGQVQPQEETVDLISSALKLKPSFFYDSTYLRQPLASYHRKRQKLSVRDEESVHALAEVFRINLRRCLDSVEIETSLPPVPAIDSDEYAGDIEEIANALRQRWGLPRGPVRDLTKIVEDAGVLIITFDFGSPLIDGFCQHGVDGLPPVVFLNSQQPKDRYRFSLAHELGHLVMHKTPNPQQEIEANRFASEFLMPTRDIRHDFDEVSLSKFMDLKLYWGTSMQALIYKAWQIGAMSDRMFKYYNIEMAKRGFKKREPIEASHLVEQPTTLKSIISAHIEDLGFSIADISDLFGLVEEDVLSLYPVEKPKPRLRLVRNE